jgi:hypothetical protein
MFSIVELTEYSKINVISSEWFANDAKTRIEIPMKDIDLKMLDPHLLNLNELTIKRIFDCVVLKENIGKKRKSMSSQKIILVSMTSLILSESYEKAQEMLNKMMPKKRKADEICNHVPKKINGKI